RVTKSTLTTAANSKGAVNVSVHDSAAIEATAGVGNLSLALGLSGSSVAAGLGISLSINDIMNTDRAVIEDTDVTSDGMVTVEAISEAEIKSAAFGIALNVSISGD